MSRLLWPPAVAGQLVPKGEQWQVTEEAAYQTLWGVEAESCRGGPVAPAEGGVFRVPGL